ncbi:MAG: DUF4390 domain-containing protein [Candidatus Krumholzibacteriota bacterium]|nr:DUF4390 domain-containing protein [Candidatus Krumholzibacteriota bacterium]
MVPAPRGIAPAVRHLLAAGLAALLAAAGPAFASPSLTLGAPAWQGDSLLVDVTLAGFFDEEVAAALSAGLPATLAVEWRLWQERALWPDRLVDAELLRFRVFFDVLEERYDVFDDAGRQVAHCADVAEVAATLCDRRRLVIRPRPRLSPAGHYTLQVSAELEPLDPREIRGLEGWLHGTDREGERGILPGISRASTEMLTRMTGLGRRRMEERASIPAAPNPSP